MWVENEEINTVILAAIDLCGDGKIEHVLEGDRWVVGAGLFADKSWPHGVV